MDSYWESKRKSFARIPKTAKILFQKSSKSSSSENLKPKSKIKSSFLNAIKSNRTSDDKCLTKNSDVQPLADKLVNNDFISQVSINNGQKLNQVKKSSSFSSTTSLATSSSSDNINSTNKENDCEFSNLISEFGDPFKLIDQSLIVDDQLNNEFRKNSQTKICCVKTQQSYDSQDQRDSPPKPPSRSKSITKLKIQNEYKQSAYQNNVNSPTIVSNSNLYQQNSENQRNYSTIAIDEPSRTSFLNKLAIDKTDINIHENVFDTCDSDNVTRKKLCGDTVNSSLSEKANKLTISIQANDQLINRIESANCMNLDKKISKYEKFIEQAHIEIEPHKAGPDNEFWPNESASATNSKIDNLNRSKHSESVKRLISTQFSKYKPLHQHDEYGIVEQQIVQKSNTMHFDRIKSDNRLINKLNEKSINSIINRKIDNSFDKLILKPIEKNFHTKLNKQPDKLDKNFENDNIKRMNKLSDKQIRDRLVNESVDKLVNKSINRLEIGSIANIALNNQSQVRFFNEIVKNKLWSSSYSSIDTLNYQSNLNTSVNLPSQRKTRIPCSKSSNALFKQKELFAFNRSKNLSADLFHDFSKDHSFANHYRECSKESIIKENLVNFSSESLSMSRKILTSNYSDVLMNSLSSCSPCTSMSSDSLDNNLHGMDESSETNFKLSSNISSYSVSGDQITNNQSIWPFASQNSDAESSINKTKTSVNQFKSSLINQLIDSSKQLKNDLSTNREFEKTKLENLSTNYSSNRQSKDLLFKQISISEDDEIDSNEISTIDYVDNNQKNVFNSKKNLFARNHPMFNKSDSCRSFEMNERIIDLEMQLTVHKTKLNESLNLIKVLSDHCNDLIQVFNQSYNDKLAKIDELIKENKRLVKQNDDYKMENSNLIETCDDLKNLLKKNLNQEFDETFNQKQHNSIKNQLELEFQCNKLQSELEHSKQNEQQLNDELINLKIKFQQNYEIYERVKSKALEKVESANKMIENANKNNEREMMLAKVKENKIQQLENELKLKIKENHELNQLLDSLK